MDQLKNNSMLNQTRNNVYSTSQHGGRMESLWGKGRGLEFNAEHSTPPVNTVPRGTGRTLWGKGRGLELNAEPSTPPINTVPHGGQVERCEERGGS